MANLLDRVSGQIREQATPRVMAGGVVLLIMLAAVGLSSLMASVDARRDRVRELDRSFAVQRSVSEGADWPQTAGTLVQRRDAVEARFWRGTTTGIVAAQLQGEIEAAANRAGLSRVRVTVQPLPDPLSGSGKFRFEVNLTASDREGQFLNFFQQLRSLPYDVIPVDFEWTRANGMTQLLLLAPAFIESSGETAAGGAP